MNRRFLHLVMASSLALLIFNAYLAPTAEATPEHTAQKSVRFERSKLGGKFPLVSYGDTMGLAFSQKELPIEAGNPKTPLIKRNEIEVGAFHLGFYSQKETAQIPSGNPSQNGLYKVSLVSVDKPKVDAYLDGSHLHFLGQNVPSEALVVTAMAPNDPLFIGIYSEGRFISLSELSLPKESFSFFPVRELQGPFPYLLENEGMQLVFSPVDGGALEINLAFAKGYDPQNPVKPVATDHKLLEQSPENSLFPLLPCWKVENGSRHLVFPKVGGYYPLIRRALIDPSKAIPAFNSWPKALAFHPKNGGKELSRYTLTRFSEDSIEWEEEVAGRRPLSCKVSLTPFTTTPYCIDLVAKGRDLREFWLASGVPEIELVSGSPQPILEQLFSKKSTQKLEQISLPKEGSPSLHSSARPFWIGNSSSFFTLITQGIGATPIDGFEATFIPGDKVPSRLCLIDKRYDRYPADEYPGYLCSVGMKGPEFSARLYTGPVDKTLLSKVDDAIEKSSGSNPLFEKAASHFGFFALVSEPFALLLFWFMEIFYKITHSWGFSIILLTLVFRIILYPLNAWSAKSATKNQALSKDLKEIERRYKSDPKVYQAKVLQFYKEKKFNPLSPFIPVIVQLPFLIGMFDLLKTHFQLRGASFISSAWIPDLTTPDVLFSWGYPIPFIGTSFHLLPILLGALMFVQPRIPLWIEQKRFHLTLTDEQRTAQAGATLMGLVFAVAFYSFPAGLSLYWLFSNLFGIMQTQWMSYQNKKVKVISK